MSNRFVRSSKFRHVFGTPAKRELCYDNLKVTRSAWDSNKAAVSSTNLACIWEAAGGGSVIVLNLSQVGKADANAPLITGHSAAILDIDWNPFNDSLLATASEDTYVKIWQIPEGGLKENTTSAVQQLRGHRRKVGTVKFNPTANNVMATSSTDLKVIVWDVESGDAKTEIDGHTDLIQSLAWDYNGSHMATASKDKKVRLMDAHNGKVTDTWEAHQGVKGSRVCYLGDRPQLLTVGFSKTTERQISVWDLRDTSKPLASQNVDTSSGIFMPFYDEDTTMLYLAGKGDGNIRYYEMTGTEQHFYLLSEYKSAVPQRGMAMLPKVAVDVSTCEVARLYKCVESMIEPISFTVPRKSDLFQDDLYPPTNAPEPTVSAAEWFGGKTGEPKKISLEHRYVKPAASATDFKPVVKDEPKELTGKELQDAYQKATQRVAYLEAELVKRDARIKELSG